MMLGGVPRSHIPGRGDGIEAASYLSRSASRFIKRRRGSSSYAKCTAGVKTTTLELLGTCYHLNVVVGKHETGKKNVKRRRNTNLIKGRILITTGTRGGRGENARPGVLAPPLMCAQPYVANRDTYSLANPT